MPKGRPPSFKPEYLSQAQKLCEFGATDVEMADFFKVAISTFYKWKNENKAFSEALKVGKSQADERVQRSLYHKAIGYTFDAVKIFMPAGADAPVYAPYREHVPPDTTACIFWLKNRRADEWRDKTEVRHEHVLQMSDDELQRIAAGGSSRAITPPADTSKLN